MTKPVRALAALLLAATLVAGCGENDDEDCDREDLASQEDECGYYDSSGVWFLYPWIVPGIGGHPPAGKHPTPPSGYHRSNPKAPAVRPNPPRPAPPPARPAPVRVGR